LEVLGKKKTDGSEKLFTPSAKAAKGGGLLSVGKTVDQLKGAKTHRC